MPDNLRSGDGSSSLPDTSGPTVPANVEGESRRVEASRQAIKLGAVHVIDLFVPVTICMIVVVATTGTVPAISQSHMKHHLEYIVFDVKEKRDIGTTVWHSLYIALIFLANMIVMSIIIVLLYKYRCMKILTGFLFFMSAVILFGFCFLYLMDLLTFFNVPFDFITLGVLLWNYGAVGIVAIHFTGPVHLQQGYLILNSAFFALFLIKYLPDWTVWFLLAIISIWDLVAVLSPIGPLRILAETAQERDESLFPSLVYSTRMVWFYGTGENEDNRGALDPNDDDESDSESREQQTGERQENTNASSKSKSGSSEGSSPTPSSTSSPGSTRGQIYVVSAEGILPLPDERDDGSEGEAGGAGEGEGERRGEGGGGDQYGGGDLVMEELADREDRGVKLGLGDFIFYSILVGKATATSDWNTTIACFVAILVGLSMTLFLLFIFRKALPALPISVAFGLFFYFTTKYLVFDFIDQCQLHQIYI